MEYFDENARQAAKLTPDDREKYESISSQIAEEKKKLEVMDQVDNEPEDRVAVERKIEQLEEERSRLLL
ncbi:hypothetical protein [Alkalicoccus halolimnae]|uniref:Uncharacterized protein n=1 Tax=Alkalicoccus halolimnae TaxID=1667239 RepID=A0A5C7F1F9_9BACI|nr:hypothetical protein [Alkalicoccus halolimnae]TXF83581.1 hypothetical protein FTX54_12175 [Alkalicoccus halolimnae]